MLDIALDQIWNAVMSISWGASLPASEAVSLKTFINDSKCDVIQVEQCEARKDRYAMLS